MKVIVTTRKGPEGSRLVAPKMHHVSEATMSLPSGAQRDGPCNCDFQPTLLIHALEHLAIPPRLRRSAFPCPS